MSQRAQGLFESLKDAALALAPGLQNIAADTKAEVARLNTQAAAELAGGLFNGHAYVPYGPGQAPSSPTQEAEQQLPLAQETQEHGIER